MNQTTHTGHSGLPTVQGVDHIGITVPDLDQAHHFLVDVLGADHIYTLGPKRSHGTWMRDYMGVHPDTEVREIRFFRLGNGANFEVFEYEAADGQNPEPRNSDIGGHHVALYVDDIDAAVAYLRGQGVEVMGDEPVKSAEHALGQRWMYFRAPWGMQFELVSAPEGKIYERDAPRLLWHPGHPTR
jgi:glyoxylase I family protein